MFTGLIQKTTTILSSKKQGKNLVLTFKTPAGWKLKIGESIATDGACLSVSKIGTGWYECTLIPETLAITKFGKNIPPTVNLEKPLRLTDLVGGHLVTGHIDTVGKITKIENPDFAMARNRGSSIFSKENREKKGGYYVTVFFPSKFNKWVIQKGSIAIDGISLTVASCANSSLTVAIIPLTLSDTTLGGKKVGDVVNLEFDLLGKYAVRKVGW